MNEIKEFSRETIDNIGYYVYRLIDPRNGETFYVGKGKGNRVFQHVKGAKEFFDNIEEDHDFSKDSHKFLRIRAIHDANLEVIHVIQRWHLSEKEAIEVEAALIDAFPGLTNLQKGHGSDFGVCSAFELENMFIAKEFEEPKDFGYIIIKVTNSRIDYCVNQHGEEKARYEATRWRWKNKKPNLHKYPYVLSVTNGIVKEVYKINDWYDAGEGRIAFNGEVAEQKIRDMFITKKIPSEYRKKGMASPFLKSKNL